MSPPQATDWNYLSDDQQLDIARAALCFAIGTVASQAEMLASEMEGGALLDRGGPDALRLLAIALRAASGDTSAPPSLPGVRVQPPGAESRGRDLALQDLASLDVAGRA